MILFLELSLCFAPTLDASINLVSLYRTETEALVSGWQYQESPPTIQLMLEKALIQITKLGRKELLLVGAGRTDAGVHAWGQVRLIPKSLFSTSKKFSSEHENESSVILYSFFPDLAFVFAGSSFCHSFQLY